jgi:hypothetical protein
VLQEPRGIRETREHIVTRERGIVGQHIVDAVTGGEELQHGLHGDARTLDDGLAVTDVGVDDDLPHGLKDNKLGEALKTFGSLLAD